MSDINELFSRNPMDLTDSDIDQIIEKMREQRKSFKQLPLGKAPKKLTEKEQKVAALKITDLKL